MPATGPHAEENIAEHGLVKQLVSGPHGVLFLFIMMLQTGCNTCSFSEAVNQRVCVLLLIDVLVSVAASVQLFSHTDKHTSTKQDLD